MMPPLLPYFLSTFFFLAMSAQQCMRAKKCLSSCRFPSLLMGRRHLLTSYWTVTALVSGNDFTSYFTHFSYKFSFRSFELQAETQRKHTHKQRSMKLEIIDNTRSRSIFFSIFSIRIFLTLLVFSYRRFHSFFNSFFRHKMKLHASG